MDRFTVKLNGNGSQMSFKVERFEETIEMRQIYQYFKGSVLLRYFLDDMLAGFDLIRLSNMKFIQPLNYNSDFILQLETKISGKQLEAKVINFKPSNNVICDTVFDLQDKTNTWLYVRERELGEDRINNNILLIHKNNNHNIKILDIYREAGLVSTLHDKAEEILDDEIKEYLFSSMFKNMLDQNLNLKINRVESCNILGLGTYKKVFKITIDCIDGTRKELVFKLNRLKIFNTQFEYEALMKQKKSGVVFNKTYFVSKFKGHSVSVEELVSASRIDTYEILNVLGRMFSIMMINLDGYKSMSTMIDDVHPGNFGFNPALNLAQCIDIGLTRNVSINDFLFRLFRNENWVLEDGDWDMTNKRIKVFRFFEGFFSGIELDEEKIEKVFGIINTLNFFDLIGESSNFTRGFLSFMLDLKIKHLEIGKNMQPIESIKYYHSQVSAA